MPFTPAHPAAILPLATRWRAPYATSALVLGSMSPDFEYFLRLEPSSTLSHTALGLVVFCLPSGLIALAVFHAIVKRPLVQLLPWNVRRRVAPALDTPRVTRYELWRVPLLILIGAATHVAWDGFTHAGGWAVERWPALEAVAWRLDGADVRVYKALQHGSTAVGLGALALGTAFWFRRQPMGPEPMRPLPDGVRRCAIAAVLAAALLVGVLAALGQGPYSADAEGLRRTTGRLVVGSMSGSLVAILVYGVAARIARPRST